jgi:hypothetical protein
VCERMQACAGLMQILRDSSAAGVAFCRTLAETAVAGEDENITVQSVAAFAVDLADYLASCAIKVHPAKSKVKAGNAVEKHGGNSAEAVEDSLDVGAHLHSP